MSQSDVLAQAKQGDSRAISIFLSHYVQTEGVTVRVTQRDDCLYILLEAAQVPDVQSMASVIERQIANLQLATVSTLMIFGRKSGEKKAIWQRVIELNVLSSGDPLSEEPPSSAPESSPILETLQPSVSEHEASLTDLAVELLSSTRSTPVVTELSLESHSDDYSASGCVAIPEVDMPDPEATPETTLDFLSGTLLEAESELTLTELSESLLESGSSLEPESLLESESFLEFDTDATLAASIESLLESAAGLDTDLDADLNLDMITSGEFSPEPDLALEPEPTAVHPSLNPEPMTTSDTLSVPDPWGADSSPSAIPDLTAATTPSQFASSSASVTDTDVSDTSKSKNPSLREVAEALHGVTTVDTQSLLQRPEAIVLLAWLSMLVVWQLYLALATDEEIPGDQILSNRKLAKRLGVHTRTLSRRRHRPDFSAWSQDLDPEGIAWVYQEDGGYAPVLATVPDSLL